MFTNQIRPARPGDAPSVVQLAIDTEMFGIDEVGFFDELLTGFFNGTLNDHHWLVLEGDDGSVHAAAYYAPEPFADRVWNVYFIDVAPDHQGRGLGATLIACIEEQLRAAGEHHARVLIVETSSNEQYARTRSFYRALGFDEEARIRQFYGPVDDKVVFWKALVRTPSP